MATSITPSTIEEIKSRTDLVDLISSYGIAVKRSGSSHVACCPFHHEKTPSFHIHPADGYYHCFGCGEKGDAITFVEKQEGLDFVEAVKKLAAGCGVTIEEKEDDPQAGLRKRLYQLHAELAQFFHRCLLETAQAAPARAYLKERGLDGELAERFVLGYAPVAAVSMLNWAERHGYTPEELAAAGVLRPPRFPGDGWYSPFAGRLVFTIRDRSGRTVAFSCRTLENDKEKMRGGKYVNSPETPIFRKSAVLYAFDFAAANIVKTPGRQALVCEGQIDVIRCHACGFGTAVASQGTAFTEEHVRLLKKCADSVVLVFDADGAGRKAAIRTGGEFLAAEIPVRVATLPPGEDPDSLLRTKGPAAFQACLDAAESITAFQVRTLQAQEANPGQIDAVKRVTTAVLDTIAHCPSAVLRASLMNEAAKLLNLPLSALEQDYARHAAAKASAAARPSAPSPASPPRRVAPQPADIPADFPPDDFFEDPPEVPQDAAAPENNPPPKVEMALCEFLYGQEGNEALATTLHSCAPDALFGHPFTRKFVCAWCRGVTTAEDALGALRAELSPAEVRWLDGILLGAERGLASELEPLRILEDFLRRLWSLAIDRRRGELPAASSPENDRKRLEFSVLARTFKNAPWARIAPLMVSATLAIPSDF